jgi:hypothetical protein
VPQLQPQPPADSGTLDPAPPARVAGEDSQRAPVWARWFVGLFLASLVICGTIGIEAWPLTGWRLFSHLRFERSTTWQAFAVASDGTERWVPFSRLPGGITGFPLIARDFDRLGPDRQSDLCQTWSEAAARWAGHTEPVRVYRVDRDLLPRAGQRAASGPRRALEFTCRGSDVQFEPGVAGAPG